jgi:hypothetical protein
MLHKNARKARKNKDRVDTVAQLNDEMQHVDVINKDIENGDASEHSDGNELLSVTTEKRT